MAFIGDQIKPWWSMIDDQPNYPNANPVPPFYSPNYYPKYEAEGVSKNAFALYRGFPTDIQREDRFSPVNSFAFSPLAQELFSIDNSLIGLLLFYIAKKDPSLVIKLFDRYMTNVSAILRTLTEAGKAHPVTSLNTQTTFAVMAHRFGLITDSGYLKLVDQQRNLLDYFKALGTVGIVLQGVETLAEAGTKITESAVSTLGSLKSLAP